MARPLKLTPELQEKIVTAVREGNYAQVAAQAAGIGETTFYRWMQTGERASSGIYREFREAIKAAEAEGEMTAVVAVRSGFGDDWKAAMTYLERRHPERWRKRDEIAHTGKDGGPLALKWENASRDEDEPAA